MPKKFTGTNTRVEAANARKAVGRAEKNAQASAAAEARDAAEWSKGSDARGAKRRDEDDRKRQEAEAKRAELKRLQALEDSELAKVEDKSTIRKLKAKEKKTESARPWEDALKTTVKKNNRGSHSAGAGKVTQAMITAKKEAEAEKLAKQLDEQKSGIAYASFGENRNRNADVEGEARSLDAAVAMLSVDDKEERHPEKRQKAAFKAYEDAQMPVMRAEYPGLKLSQYKQKIFENWKKSPENPMNQASVAYDTKK